MHHQSLHLIQIELFEFWILFE